MAIPSASTARRRRATTIPGLNRIIKEIRGHAVSYGLDFFEVIFELVDYDELNEIAAFGGFPTRYPHWKFGMDYEQLSKGYTYGLQKIYELVINNDPCYAYLMKSNSLVDQKLVIAHVYGHSDFFKNNAWFAVTDRKMIDEMANHGNRIRRYMEQHGVEKVESFIDACLSIDNLIDPHSPYIRRRATRTPPEPGEEHVRPAPYRLKGKSYMDRFLNPPEFLEEQRQEIERDIERQKNFPEEPERDILLFLIEHTPKRYLDSWQRDILSIIREEAYYFAPQRMTKIMNEGWASFWHSTMMTSNILRDDEVIDYADHHAATLASSPGVLNPYKIGIELFRDIEDRWNRGRFGKEFEECDDMAVKAAWDKQLGLGREKIFEVRRVYNDLTFIDAFLTEDFCEEHKLFTYEYNKHTQEYVITSRDFQRVKQKLLFQLGNFGNPYIYVVDGNYDNRGELYLQHRHEGMDLKQDYAKEVLKNINRVWGRPVHLETVVDKRRKVLTYDGKKHGERGLA